MTARARRRKAAKAAKRRVEREERIDTSTLRVVRQRAEAQHAGRSFGYR